jgi:hypothetical protein
MVHKGHSLLLDVSRSWVVNLFPYAQERQALSHVLGHTQDQQFNVILFIKKFNIFKKYLLIFF